MAGLYIWPAADKPQIDPPFARISPSSAVARTGLAQDRDDLAALIMVNCLMLDAWPLAHVQPPSRHDADISGAR
jgi:hypothetical protein